MPGYFGAKLVDVLRQKHLVHAAMALPQHHAAAADRLGRLPPSVPPRGSQRGISSSGMPIARAVLRPRC